MSRYTAPVGFALFALWIAIIFVLTTTGVTG
jgi:hypothetical protein